MGLLATCRLSNNTKWSSHDSEFNNLTYWNRKDSSLFTKLETFSVNWLLKGKVHIFWEGHKILQNLHQLFDWQYTGQIIGGDFAKGPGAKKATRKSPGYFNQILNFESWKWSRFETKPVFGHEIAGNRRN